MKAVRDEKSKVIRGLQSEWLRQKRLAVFNTKAEPTAFKAWDRMMKVLENGAHNWKTKRFVLWVGIGATCGWFIGMAVENLLMSIILALVGSMAPYYYLEQCIRQYERDRNEKLLIVMSSLQAEYLKPHTPFIHAVTSVLPTIPDPLYSSFKRYADTINLFHPDSPLEALKVLDSSVDNYFFTEYISLAMLAEEGEQGLKATMSAIPDEYQSYLETNRVFSFKVAVYNQNFQMTLLTFPLMVGFLRVTSEEYYEILTHHFVGKLTLVVLTLLYLGAAVVFNRLNAEVRLDL